MSYGWNYQGQKNLLLLKYNFQNTFFKKSSFCFSNFECNTEVVFQISTENSVMDIYTLSEN